MNKRRASRFPKKKQDDEISPEIGETIFQVIQRLSSLNNQNEITVISDAEKIEIRGLSKEQNRELMDFLRETFKARIHFTRKTDQDDNEGMIVTPRIIIKDNSSSGDLDIRLSLPGDPSTDGPLPNEPTTDASLPGNPTTDGPFSGGSKFGGPQV